MPRLTAICLILAAALLFAPTAEAATCRSGKTVYKQQGVRVFAVPTDVDSNYYACGPRTRRPAFLQRGSDGLRVSRHGERVLFEDSSTVGWFDPQTSEVRKGDLAGDDDYEIIDMVAAADGGVGVLVAFDVGLPSNWHVDYLAPGSKPGALEDGHLLASAGGSYDPSSLAFAEGDRALTWRQSGQTRTVPLTGEVVSCTAGATIIENAGTRVIEVLPAGQTVLAACPAGATEPQQLAVRPASSPWARRYIRRAGARVAFLLGDHNVLVFDGAQVTFHPLDDIERVQDIAIADLGPVAFAGATREADQEVIGLTSGERLATQGDSIQPLTLAIADGRVTWRSGLNGAQSTPLAGETKLDCTVGSTLLNDDGLRVFELLPAGANDARLYACVPGAAAPLLLVSAQRTASWDVFELVRGNGRFALHVRPDSRGAQERVMIFDADEVRAGVARRVYGVGVKDIVLAADGRLVAAVRINGKWTIVAFTPGAPGTLNAERAIARPSGGVRVGTLAIKGRRAVWRSFDGARRGAAI